MNLSPVETGYLIDSAMMPILVPGYLYLIKAVNRRIEQEGSGRPVVGLLVRLRRRLVGAPERGVPDDDLGEQPANSGDHAG